MSPIDSPVIRFLHSALSAAVVALIQARLSGAAAEAIERLEHKTEEARSAWSLAVAAQEKADRLARCNSVGVQAELAAQELAGVREVVRG